MTIREVAELARVSPASVSIYFLSIPTDRPHDAKTDADIVATAYFFRSTDLTAKAAVLLGLDTEARHYADLAARIATAFRDAYVTPMGRMMSDAPPPRTRWRSCSTSSMGRNEKRWGSGC